MNNFTEHFINEIIKYNKDITVKRYYNKENSLILNYPYKNINIEIKPNNTGLFVIQLIDFEFFDYALLEDYWKKVLHHKDANFILNSKCVYIYPKQSENIELCLNVLNYTTETILCTLDKIKNLLRQIPQSP